MRKNNGQPIIQSRWSSRLAGLMRLLALELIALLTSVAAVGLIGLLVVSAADYKYNINHAIPDPVERGEDYGLGLIVVGAAIASLLVSILFSVLIHLFIFRKFLKGRKEG